MANIMTKTGRADNIVTYEHICDTVEDMANIEPEYITLGSVCIVIKGSAGLEAYIADTSKEWTKITNLGGGIPNSGSDSGSISNALLNQITVAYNHASTRKGAAFESGFYKIQTNSEGHVIAVEPVTQQDINPFVDELTANDISAIIGAMN